MLRAVKTKTYSTESIEFHYLNPFVMIVIENPLTLIRCDVRDVIRKPWIGNGIFQKR